ncbi:isoprenylcysteine carboxylmethyltransferase family protein [Streptomyces sp. FH025]|uniref:methyltransferase family protein n=1 Tax=Streptomyces sp. FH025 TaxID=2815937 RepID=UPI001A9F1BC7|nr:isoprenylcysteine carboxylmethyltransferase family protein [Streptomyces sp. FH025]MBO1415487.1 isoprenylcysteine carboxylmethyltransferase family protein [Streptomyces sp. FH025]
MSLPSLLSVLGLLCWVGYELLLRRREDAAAGTWRADGRDRGSTRLLISCYVVSVLVVVVFDRASIGGLPDRARWLGVALVAVGLALRAWGMRTLGRYYTRTLRTVDTQRVVRSGPYRLIRHPGYAGSLLVWGGYAFGTGGWTAAVVVTALLLGAYGWRVAAEERLLLEAFGAEYAEYRRVSKRLVPFVY